MIFNKKHTVRRCRIWKAVRNESGASIIFALLFFAIATVAGVIALAAASTTVGQITALEDTQKAQYSATSSAKAITDLLEGSRVLLSDDATGLKAAFIEPGKEDEEAYDIVRPNTQGTTLTNLGDVVSGLVTKVIDSGNTSSASATLRFSLENDVIDASDLFLTMMPDYRITIRCISDGAALNIEFPPSIGSSESNGHPAEIRWVSPVITQGN